MSAPRFSCSGCQRPFATADQLENHSKQCRIRKQTEDLALEDHRQQLIQASRTALDEDPLEQHRRRLLEAQTGSRKRSLSPSPHPEERRLPQQRLESLVSSPTPSAAFPTEDDVPHAMFDVEMTPPPFMPPPNPSPADDELVMEAFTTDINQFGLYRVYPTGQPSYVPDFQPVSDSISLEQPSSFHEYTRDVESHLTANTPLIPVSTINYSTAPVSRSVHMIVDWHWEKAEKTPEDTNHLVNDVLLNEKFELEELRGFRGIARETELVDGMLRDEFSENEAWIKGSVTLSVPSTQRNSTEAEAPKFTVDGVYYRNLLDVIKGALREPGAERFHISPYKEYWKPTSDAPATRVYDELYTSDAFLEEHISIRRKALKEGIKMETVVAGLMLSSDAAQMAHFGTATLHPIYLFMGNLSKYIRSKPSSLAAHHVAYIPKMPDDFSSWFDKEFGGNVSTELMAIMRKELYQGVLALLANPEFVHAYFHGFEWEFWDAVVRLVFPRLFTHSADYPEKMIIACLKYLSTCPCPRCLVPKELIYRVGTASDMAYRMKHRRKDEGAIHDAISTARRWVFEGTALSNEFVVGKLEDKSLTITRSALSIQLNDDPSFDIYAILSSDLLHEFDLGVWKDVFTHLIRMLQSRGHHYVNQLNDRYRSIPTFGRDTIRRFSNNVSEMKKLAGRDFEDLLQCALPAFDGLFEDKHNSLVHDLIWELLTWMSLAKLRKHTQQTLGELDASTTRLGKFLRKFASESKRDYDTRDLPKEVEKKRRRSAAKAAKRGNNQVETSADTGGEGLAKHIFNMNTPKIHGLGHVKEGIIRVGCTDGYNTMLGEAEHRRSKRWFKRSKKGAPRVFVQGIAKQERRARVLHRMKKKGRERTVTSLPFSFSDPLPKATREIHHQVSHQASPANRYYLREFLTQYRDDPAFKSLRRHLFLRLRGLDYTDDQRECTPGELSSVVIVNDALYVHKILRVNYTTYDTRREQDSINARTHPDIMMLSRDTNATTHPYWYARVYGVFHVRALLNDPRAPGGMGVQDVEMVWVRYYGVHYRHRSGWKARALPKVGFVDPGVDGTDPFDFIDPLDIIRGVHLIPSFTDGRSSNGLGPTVVRPEGDRHEDYNYFYVNVFVDRDMFMRFRGGGVGHVEHREATNVFLKDRDALDMERVEKELLEGDKLIDSDQISEMGDAEEMSEDGEQWENVDGSDSSTGDTSGSSEAYGSDWGPEDGENEPDELYDYDVPDI